MQLFVGFVSMWSTCGLFSMFGIPHIELEYGVMFFVKPILIFSLGYFVFGYISSRKVKNVSSRELIIE